ncbi:MAG: DUF4824 family protein [Gallionella sp.]
MRNRLIGIGFAIVLLTNVLVLGNVFYNRSGSPDSQLALSERELTKSWRGQSKENSGVALMLHWRVIPRIEHGASYNRYAMDSRSPAWLDQQKMQTLGFSTAHNQDETRYSSVEKEVILVLELNGAAYQQAVSAAQKNVMRLTDAANSEHDKTTDARAKQEQLKNAQQELAEEQSRASRLFVIDAGLDATALRARYPDRQRYALMRGLIQESRQYLENKPQLFGYISQVHNREIHIPQEFASVTTAPHYTAQVAFGSKLEPWVVGVTAHP